MEFGLSYLAAYFFVVDILLLLEVGEPYLTVECADSTLLPYKLGTDVELQSELVTG